MFIMTLNGRNDHLLPCNSGVFLYKYSCPACLSIHTKTRLFMAEYICLRISECLNPVLYNVASG